MAIILVVDDHPLNRDFLTTLLHYAGHSLLEAASAGEALAIARAVQPDLLIADVLMPVIDGFELVRLLRADPAIAHTRVLFYTATYLAGEVLALARSCGVLQVLAKPTDPELILRAVEAALSAPLPAIVPLPAATFEQEHQRVLLSKLAEQTDALDLISGQLDQRVYERTAELDRANRTLIELNRAKDDMLTIISHDLRSPLGAIQSMAEIMMEDEQIPDELRRRLTRNIYDSARRLIELVTKMLDLARLEAGKVELEGIELRASDVVRQSIDCVRASAAAKQIGLDLIVDPGEMPLLADWLRLSQVLVNLLSNAIKFTSMGGQIAVLVRPEASGMCVSVADTGRGISAEALPHLFEKFSSAHSRGTANEPGSGLGLAIARELVELHGGTVEVASELNLGSTFTIHLPALRALAGAA